MRVSVTARGKPAAKPQGKKEKEAFDIRMWEAHQFACTVLTMTDHEPGSVPKMQAERELMLAKFQHIELENSQLREKVEKLLPALTQAVQDAGSVLRAAGPAAATPTPERRPKKQKTRQEQPAHAETHVQTGDEPVEDGMCGWCEQKNRRRVTLYGVVRGRDGPDATPRTLAVCRDSGGCAKGLLADGNGSLTPPDTESGSIQSEAVPETAVAS